MLIVLRHARAGPKLADAVRDFERPLDATGRAAAIALPDVLLDCCTPSTIVSSPFLRCTQTVAPLARRLGLNVEERHELTPPRPLSRVLLFCGPCPTAPSSAPTASSSSASSSWSVRRARSGSSGAKMASFVPSITSRTQQLSRRTRGGDARPRAAGSAPRRPRGQMSERCPVIGRPASFEPVMPPPRLPRSRSL